MIDQKYSITRTRATWKPRVAETDLPFFRCPSCGRVYQGITGTLPTRCTGTGRTLVAELPYARDLQKAAFCCEEGMKRLEFAELDEVPDSIALDYRILGGYNSNSVECSWSISDERYSLVWVMLKTFTGTQMKYVLPKKRSPLLFALADEDAYVYCDESPCLECTFMCKRGFVLYAGIADAATAVDPPDSTNEAHESAPLTSFVIRMPLTRMSPYWESRP